VPGYTAAALTSQLPLSGDQDEYGAHFEAGPGLGGTSHSVYRYSVSPGYTDVLRIPVRQGRGLTEADRAGAPLVVLISESLARRRFGDRSPLGERLRIGAPGGPALTIVGVVGDIKQMSLAMELSDAVYVPMAQAPFGDAAMSLVVRGASDPTRLAPDIRRAIWSVDKDQPVVRLATMDALLEASAAERRFVLVLFEAFGLTALLLAAAGIYGVLSGSVAERTREIGVRTALGASRTRIAGLVLGQGLRLTALGVALGLAGAMLAGRAIAAMLFGVSPLDPLTYGGMIGLLGAIALLASWVPAWRAARVDPATTLREE
jgi:putative ABC transport system permease protein